MDGTYESAMVGEAVASCCFAWSIRRRLFTHALRRESCRDFMNDGMAIAAVMGSTKTINPMEM